MIDAPTGVRSEVFHRSEATCGLAAAELVEGVHLIHASCDHIYGRERTPLA